MRSFMHNGRRYREVSLDTPADEEVPSERESLGKIMRGRPLPALERAGVVRTRNGNLVQAVAR